MREGIDYAWGAPPAAAIAAAGYGFALVYLPGLGDPAAHVDAAELAGLRAADLGVGFILEGVAQRMAGGATVGATDGATAAASLATLGVPAAAACFFAADWDAQPDEFPAIDDYLRAAAGALGAERVGVYGSFAVVEHCLAVGSARFGWQAAGWAYGHAPVHAHLWQYGPQATIAGVTVDLDRQLLSPAGLWEPEGEIMRTFDITGESGTATVLADAPHWAPTLDGQSAWPMLTAGATYAHALPIRLAAAVPGGLPGENRTDGYLVTVGGLDCILLGKDSSFAPADATTLAAELAAARAKIAAAQAALA